MTKHPLILQTHKCHRVDGDHRPGFDCLDDLQVINLMLYLDVDSLINLGKASERLYHLVCDKKVWRSLLKRVEDFTTERVQQLTVFLEKSSSSQEMRQEVLREAARRLHEQVAEGVPRMEFSVCIPGWGNPSVFQMDAGLHPVPGHLGYSSYAPRGPWCLEQLRSLAQALGGAKFNIIKFNLEGIWADHLSATVLQVLANQMSSQDEMVCLKLSSLVYNTYKDLEKSKTFLALMQKSKEWKIGLLRLYSWDIIDLYSAALDKGHIGHLELWNSQMAVNLDDLKRVWLTAEKFTLVTHYLPWREFGGGRGENPEGDWKLFLDYLASLTE